MNKKNLTRLTVIAGAVALAYWLVFRLPKGVVTVGEIVSAE